MLDAILQIAQSSPPEKTGMASRVIWASILVVPLLVVAGMMLVYLRKKTLDAEQERGAAGSLMEQLRTMHDRGEISDAEYEQTRKSIASRVSHVMDTKRGGGLFELPDPKRRVARREMGPIAPAPEPPGKSVAGPATPAPGNLPPGYGAEGGSAKPDGPSP